MKYKGKPWVGLEIRNISHQKIKESLPNPLAKIHSFTFSSIAIQPLYCHQLFLNHCFVTIIRKFFCRGMLFNRGMAFHYMPSTLCGLSVFITYTYKSSDQFIAFGSDWRTFRKRGRGYGSAAVTLQSLLVGLKENPITVCLTKTAPQYGRTGLGMMRRVMDLFTTSVKC